MYFQRDMIVIMRDRFTRAECIMRDTVHFKRHQMVKFTTGVKF